jgi:hypothetical protein
MGRKVGIYATKVAGQLCLVEWKGRREFERRPNHIPVPMDASPV